METQTNEKRGADVKMLSGRNCAMSLKCGVMENVEKRQKLS